MVTSRLLKPAICLLMAMGVVTATGCDNSDQRLAEYARHSVQQQAQQNEHIARQSEAVAKQSQELAEAAHKIVEADAQARQELIAAQREFNGDLQQERGSLDRQREEMEQERQRIAKARHRDPIVAAAIQATGLVLACLLPLLVCAYALRQLARTHQDDEGLNDLLVQEIVAEESLLEMHPPSRLAAEKKSAPLLPPPADRE